MTRRILVFVLSLVAFSGTFVAALATIQQRDFYLRGYVDATRTVELPFYVPRLGVNAELTQYTSEELRHNLTLMTQGNVVWVRQYFRWDEIEPAEGIYDWEQWDRVVAAVDEFPSLRLVAVLVNSPAWARPSTASAALTAPPESPDAFARFAGDLAQRYGHSLSYYQIWDEPNIELGWGGLEPRAAGYSALLQAGYHAIHSADSGAVVIAAALAPTTETGPQNISDISYLRDLYLHGAADFADAFAGKPYGFDFPADDRTVEQDRLNFSRIVALREVMIDFGDGQKPLWASAWGWNSLPDGWPGESSIWGKVTQEERTAYTLEALDRASREWPWLGGMILQHWQPDAPAEHPQWGFALLDSASNPSDLWQALVEYPMPATAVNGLFPPQNPFTRYRGIWLFSEFGADVGWVQDSSLEFDFTGREVALLLRQDDFVAYLYVTIDNQRANALPRDVAGNAYVMLRSGSLQPEARQVTVAQNLSDVPHTLRIVVDELIPDDIVNRWPLIGFAVSSGDLAAPYNRQITMAWITAILAGLAATMTGSSLNWASVLPHFRSFWQALKNVGQLVASGITSIALLAGMYLTWSDGAPEVFRRESVQLGLSIITAGLIYINQFSALLTLVTAFVLFVIIYNRLELGLILTIFWVPFFLFPVEFYRFAFPMAEVVVLITFAAWSLRMLAAWGRNQQAEVGRCRLLPFRGWLRAFTAIDYFMIAWVILGFLSVAWAEHRQVAVTELRTLIVQPAMFYLVLRTIQPNRAVLTRLVDTLIVAGFAVALIGLFMWLRGEGVITAEEGVRRLAGVYGSPNNVGLFLGRCIPFALAFVLIKVDRPRRAMAAMMLMFMLVAVILTQSAGALIIGAPSAVAAVLVFTWRRRAVPVVLGLVVVGAFILLAAAQSPRFSRVFELSQGTNFYRVRVWESAMNMVDDYPLTGIGLDQFLYKYRGEYIMPDAWEEPDLSHPHNVVLDVWLRMGMAGLIVFLGIQFAFWQRIHRVYLVCLLRRHTLSLGLLVGTMGSMINLLAHGLVDNSVFVIDLAYIFVLLLGLSTHLPNVSAIDEKSEVMV
jgi:O-antigen ligase